MSSDHGFDPVEPEKSGDGSVDPSESTGPSLCAYTEYEQGPPVEDLPATGEGATGLEARVWDALYGVDDPEMPVSIVDLGLIYGVRVIDGESGSDGRHVVVDMTLTYSGCPAREMLQDDVRAAVGGVEGVGEVTVRLVWSPEWSLEMVTEAGREDLREFGLSVEAAT